MPQAAPAKNFYAESPGRWIAEQAWPGSRIKPKRLYLNGGGQLGERAGKPSQLAWRSPQTLKAPVPENAGETLVKIQSAK